MDWRVRPIDKWPGERTKAPTRALFSTPWGGTLHLLERELGVLRAKNILLLMNVRDEDLRLDGWIKASARPSDQGVILSFDSKHGPLKYACDAFTDWTSNVRAIALGLEALRKVDRYGIARRGEQYRGYRALPGPSDGAMTKDTAAGILAKWSGIPTHVLLEQNGDVLAAAARIARTKTHPDKGGQHEDFVLVERAFGLLRSDSAEAP